MGQGTFASRITRKIRSISHFHNLSKAGGRSVNKIASSYEGGAKSFPVPVGFERLSPCAVGEADDLLGAAADTVVVLPLPGEEFAAP